MTIGGCELCKNVTVHVEVTSFKNTWKLLSTNMSNTLRVKVGRHCFLQKLSGEPRDGEAYKNLFK